jgi:putative tryptophan/tyrosine transport system substrate-binding protein
MTRGDGHPAVGSTPLARQNLQTCYTPSRALGIWPTGDQLEEITMRLTTVGLIATLTLAILVAPLVAKAQPSAPSPKVGWLEGSRRTDKEPLHAVFLQGLRELGYVEGQNLILVRRDMEGQPDRLPALAAELVQLPVDVLVTTGGVPATRAAMRVTTIIPIVMAEAGDPVETGLVASLARPGGNVTGLSSGGPSITGRRLQLLKEAAPGVARVAVLYHPPFAATVLNLHEVQAAASALGLTVLPMEVRTPDEFDDQFAAMLRLGADALLIAAGPFGATHRQRILELAATHRLPTACGVDAESGCLIAYGSSLAAMYRRAASYVDKILKGTKPSDLPVEQPMKFELFINLKTAKALGLTIPPALLVLADKVLQ